MAGNYKQMQQYRLFLLLVVFSYLQFLHVDGTPQVPCYFIFGDSLSDNGNNNNRLTLAKANYLPYGVNFPSGPTGRCTNNRTIVDVISQLLGFDEFIPSFANAIGGEVVKGVNYASTAAGILETTGRLHQGDVISLNQQLSNHLITISTIKLLMGLNSTAAEKHLNKCLYTVGMGSSDYVDNYFAIPDVYNTISTYTQEQFANLLILQYTQQLKTLHSYGARKVAVFGLNLLGLAPGMISQLGVIEASKVTAASLLFTRQLQGLVDKLNNELPGAKFTYINIPSITLLAAPSLIFLNTVGTCCEVVDVFYTCKRGSTACPSPNGYAFFDGYHPTDVVNVAMAGRAYQDPLRIASSPYDIRTLAALSN